MLEPLDRRHLLDALRPPEGYDVDVAIGTTYSLNLMTLLTVPLAFAMFDWEDDEGRAGGNPLALLEATRRYADRVHIFCQAGCILLPKQHSPLLYQLEKIVHEVAPSGGRGIFHPKLWVIRFTTPNRDEPTIYRVLCLSRNLTFDRSWDTMLVLEGELTDRQRAIGGNHPLGDLVRALPTLMLQPVGDTLRKMIARVHRELRRVRFDVPDGFINVRFHALGIGEPHEWWFDSRCDRMLALAPFVDGVFMRRFASRAGSDGILVSRLEQLQEIDPELLKKCGKVYYLDPNADADAADQEPEELSGLHAKLYVTDDGWNSSVWTGSANATSAAFARNVEFMTELVGKRSVCGVEAFMRTAKGQTLFADMLREFVPGGSAPEKDKDAQRAEERAEQARRFLASAQLAACVTATPADDRFQIEVKATAPKPLSYSGLEVYARPIGLHERDAVEASSLLRGQSISFQGLSFESLTSFVAFHIKASVGKSTHDLRFVLNLPIDGLPEDRAERMLRSILSNKNQVLRLLLLLLADSSSDMLAQLLQPRRDPLEAGEATAFPYLGELALLEPLLRTLEQNPRRLERIAQLVKDLQKTPGGMELLPPNFLSVWEPIWSTAQNLINETPSP